MRMKGGRISGFACPPHGERSGRRGFRFAAALIRVALAAAIAATMVAALSCSEREYSNPVDTSVTLDAPQSVTANALADTAVLVTWIYSGKQVSGFEVDRQTGVGGFTQVVSLPASARSFTHVTGLVGGQAYSYRIRAINSENSSEYKAGTAITFTLAAPTNVSLSSEVDSALVVTWIYNNNSQTGFSVERQIGAGSFIAIATVGAAARTCRDLMALSDGLSYTYHVRALSKNNQSVFATSSTFPASLAAPSNLTIPSFTSTQVQLQWQDNSNIERGFQVEQSSDGTTYALATTSGPNATSATVNGTYSTTTTYYFRVRAFANSGFGSFSNPATTRVFPDMVFVEGGTFQMGSTSGFSDEQPVHAVTLSSFMIDKYEVTVAQYRAFCDATSRTFPSAPSWGWNDTDPMVYVSWEDATAYAAWAGKRLPTEAEWEYAARGGKLSQGYTYAGSNSIDPVAWYTTNSGSKAHTVGTKAPNEWGIYDMSGNVWEWVQDWYGSYLSGAVVNPQGPTTGTWRVHRGGSWANPESSCRITLRSYNYPGNEKVGFRCARDW
jgi:formylglycine-generating enzyme